MFPFGIVLATGTGTGNTVIVPLSIKVNFSKPDFSIKLTKPTFKVTFSCSHGN